MKREVMNIDYDIMMSYELRTGFKGLGEFLVNLGVAKLVLGESCPKK